MTAGVAAAQQATTQPPAGDAKTQAPAPSAARTAQQAAAASEPVWVRTGGPIGGIGYDIRSRPDNPDVMMVTDVTSGLNISLDGGRTWAPSNTGMDVNFTFSATIDPNNNDIAWAGTQARMGIFKSTDGGRTWARKTNGVVGDEGISFRGFTVEPGNSNVVYAAGEIGSIVWNSGVPLLFYGADRTKGMVYKTTDGGEHWTQIWQGDNVARYVWIDPRDTKVLYVSTGFFDRAAANANPATNEYGGVGIVKTTDGGQTWRVLNKTNGLGGLFVTSLFMHPTNPDILVAGTGGGDLIGSGVYVTANGGETWRLALVDPVDTNDPTRGMPFTAIEISPVSPNVVFAATNNSFYRSDDGGSTWNRYNYPGSLEAGNPFWGPPGMKSGTPIDLEADRRDPMRVYGNMYQGGNLLSTDGGKTWANTSRGYTGAMVKGVQVDNAHPAVAYAVASNGVFKSTDAGGDWQGLNTVAANFTAEMETVAVSPSNGQHVLTSDAFNGSMYKSVDGGRSWDRMLNYASLIAPLSGGGANNDALQGFSSIVFAPSDPRIVYAGLGARYCFSSNAPSSACDYPMVKGVHRSTDGGTTWEVVAGAGLGVRSIRALAVHPTTPDLVYAVTGAPGVFKTQDGGKTWVSVNNGIASLYMRSIAIDGSSTPETVYLGTGSAAIFKSTDGGASWRSSSAGLPPAMDVRALVVDATNPSTVWAAGGGGGSSPAVYRSTDAGATWVSMNGGRQLPIGGGLAISNDGGTVYSASWGDGVYRLDIPVAPRIHTQPSSAVVAAGTAANFAATASSGVVAPTAQWQVSTDGGSNWNDIAGAASATYAITAALTDHGKRYRAVFTNSLGSATSTAAVLSVAAYASVITWAAPASITYGTALGATQQNATANVAGTFAYDPAPGTILAIGTHTLTTTFTPADPVTYAPATKSVSIDVVPVPVPPTINGFTPGMAVAGTTVTVTGTNLTGTTSVTFNGVSALFTVVSNTQITAVVPVGTSTGPIVVTTPAGSVSTLPYSLIVVTQRASRSVPACYGPGSPLTVTLDLGPASSVTTYSVVDQPPATWTLGAISDSGGWDATTGRIKWGPFADATARMITYVLTPPADASGTVTFVGAATFDSISVAIDGTTTLAKCDAHPADANGDGRLVISEVTGYGAAWKKGTTWATDPNPIPISYVTRAGYLWRAGETYRADSTAGACPICWVPRGLLQK
jgi:photosystem II stability/assembly factor-like uncharacterized protein